MQQIPHLIGFFCDTPMIGSSYKGMLEIGFMSGCRKWDCSLLTKSFDFHDKDIPDQVARVLERTPLSGVILPEPMCDMQEVLDVLFAAGVPVVRITPHSKSSQAVDICIDNCQAAYDLTTFLIGLGHKRIGFIRGPSDHYDAEIRFEGFCKAMEEAGLEVLDDLCPVGTFDYTSGLISGEKLLALTERPTAIFACNDDIAAAVLATAYSMGLKVPQDVSLAGFDDAPIARMVWPPLTTCRQKMELTGYMAIDFLIDPPNASDARLRPQQHELVIRKSTARVKA